MVSKSSVVCYSKRAVSGAENAPSDPASKGAVAAMCARQRRRRALLSTPKYLVEQSQRRNDLTATKQSRVQPPAMTDANSTTRPTAKNTVLPRVLVRPSRLGEVSSVAIAGVDPTLIDVSPQYVRDHLEEFGSSLWGGISDIRAFKQSSTNGHIDVLVPNTCTVPPTHVLALYNNSVRSRGTANSVFPTQRLVAVHSIFPIAHCSKLPPFVATTSNSSYSSGSSHNVITLPVQPIGLPSPETFPVLAEYLYVKRTETLLDQILPSPAPPALEYDQLSGIPAFGAQLARDFSQHGIARHINLVHGLWRNACALGVVDVQLWDTIDIAWEVLLHALAVSTGKPELTWTDSLHASSML